MKHASYALLFGLVALHAGLGCSSSDGGGGGSGGASAGSSAGASGGGGTAGRGAGGAVAGTGGSASGGATAGASGGAAGTVITDGGAADAATGGTKAGAGGMATGGAGGATATGSFFVTSNKNMTGNLGGLEMADKRCQDLAATVGLGGKTWHAYLSVTSGPGGQPVNAKDRIGSGPWFNVKGVMLAKDLTELHARFGDYQVFLDEKGNPVPGQWQGSPTPNEHDVLTGTTRAGELAAGQTCNDWKSDTGSVSVGHTDGLGPNGSTQGNVRFWNAAHTSPCGDLKSTGGAGRLYCFAIAP